MKHQEIINRQRAYTAYPTSHERQISLQREAAAAALIKGDMDEYSRCNLRADRLVNRRATPRAQGVLPASIIRAALGKNDSIVRMFKDGHLSVHQVGAAMDLRAYEQGEAVSGAGGDFTGDYVDGGSADGMEALIDKLRPGREAKARIKEQSEALFQPVWLVIVTGRAPERCIGMMQGRNEEKRLRLRAGVQDSLTLAMQYFGHRAGEG